MHFIKSCQVLQVQSVFQDNFQVLPSLKFFFSVVQIWSVGTVQGFSAESRTSSECLTSRVTKTCCETDLFSAVERQVAIQSEFRSTGRARDFGAFNAWESEDGDQSQ